MLEGEKASNRSKLEPSDNSNPKHWFHSDKSEWRKLPPNTCWTRESTNRISRCLNNYSLNALQCCHFKANNPVETSLSLHKTTFWQSQNQRIQFLRCSVLDNRKLKREGKGCCLIHSFVTVMTIRRATVWRETFQTVDNRDVIDGRDKHCGRLTDNSIQHWHQPRYWRNNSNDFRQREQGGQLYLGSQAYFQLIFRSCYKIPQNMDHQNDLLIDDYL